MQLISRNTDESCVEEYHLEILRRISDYLSQGPQTLSAIVRACAGAYPTIVRECIEEYRSKITWTDLPAAALCDPERSAERSILDAVEGNPVLCSWYFTTQTCRRIAKLRDWSSLRLAFLGTPRLYDWFRSQNLGKERLLLDLDAVVLEKLSAFSSDADVVAQYDIADKLPDSYRGRFDFVFFDPPWYPVEYFTWLGSASLLAPGGHVVFSLFPELTRPSADAERRDVLEFCGRFSEELTLVSSFLDYEIPTFELGQLRAAGLSSIGPWRVADLVIAKINAGARPDFDRGDAERTPASQWREVDIGGLRLFVNLLDRREHEPRLLMTPTGTSTILPSPSRREPTRKKVNVLSSRGHGLVTSRPTDLVQILESLSRRRAGASLNDEIRRQPIDAQSQEILTEVLKEV
jgi:hypothetical protein